VASHAEWSMTTIMTGDQYPRRSDKVSDKILQNWLVNLGEWRVLVQREGFLIVMYPRVQLKGVEFRVLVRDPE